MKISFLQFHYEFDRDDAKIVVPIILLILGVFFTTLDRPFLLAIGVAYYLCLFFSGKLLASLNRWREQARMRCPKCKNRKIYMQGYDTHNSDEIHAFYFCDRCNTTSILTGGGLLEV